MPLSYELLWGKTELSEKEREELLPYLSNSERIRVEFLNGLRAERYLAGRLLSRQLGAKLLGTHWSEAIPVAFCHECGMDHGTIMIQGSNVNLSLSSAGEVLVVAGAVGNRIGIDIETGLLQDTRVVAGSLGNLEVTLAHWCEYEAKVKMFGTGIGVEIDTVDRHIAPNEYELHAARQHGDLVLAVAVSR